MTTEYRSAKAINATAIKAGARSLKHMHHCMTCDREPTSAMSWGTLCHAALFLPDPFMVWPDRKAGKAWDAFEEAAQLAGKIVVKPHELDKLNDLKLSLYQNIEAATALLTNKAHEVPVYWEEPGIGKCKALPDSYGVGVLADLKTAAKIDERSFTAASWAMGYHLQLAWYRRGLRANGQAVDKVAIVAIESAAPFDTCLYWLDDGLLEFGDLECLRIAGEYNRAKERGVFPGAHMHPRQLIQPAYADEQIQGVPEDEMDASEL